VAGWCLILAVAVTYTSRTPFPGWRAAVPVLGAALVIAANSRMRWYRVPGVQWLGDVSYSVYLWHWPLIVIVPVALGRLTGSPARGRVGSILIVIATLVLAGLTKLYVEDRFRTPTWSRRMVPSLAGGAVGMALVVTLATSLVVTVHRQERDDARAVQVALAGSDRCLGARALEPGNTCPQNDRPLVPSPVLAANDISPAYDKRADGSDCMSHVYAFRLVTCQFGDPNGDVDVALVGNSHAAQWLPALQQIASTRHWRITTYLAMSCTAADLPQAFPSAAGSAACIRWTRHAAAAVARERPDLIVFANRTGHPAAGESSLDASLTKYTAGFRKSLEEFSASGAPVVVIRDTPIPIYGGIDSVPDCLALHPDDHAACSGPRSVWLPADPSVAAARSLAGRGVSVADLTSGFCDRTTCWSAIGSVIVYSDGHHVTHTYSRTLAPRLDAILVKRLGQG
jgi:SGNH domain (fused to AT3 domains)